MAMFFSCDIQTGQILEELPLKIEGSLQRALMTPMTGSFSLHVLAPECPDAWEQLTALRRVQIVACDDSGKILWSGMPTSRIRNATSPIVTIGAATLEEYLGCRYTPEKKFTQADQCSQIVNWMVKSCVQNGVPMEINTPVSGVKRDRSYWDDDAGTVLQRLTELSGVIGGPEWTIDTVWNSTQTRIKNVFRTGYPHIGVVTDKPMGVFEIQGGLTEATHEERYTVGESATHITALGSGSGLDKPVSDPAVDAGAETAGWPRVEYRRTYDSVTQKSTLNQHAAGLLKRMAGGTSVFSLKQRYDEPPILGEEWGLGDSVLLLSDTDTLRISQVVRVVGWELTGDLTEITPLLADMAEKTPDEGDTHG